MYIETSAPRRRGDKARFVSEDFPPVRGSRCLNFWYHMYGRTIDTLKIYIKTGPGNSSSAETPIWQLSGNFGNQWLNGQVPLRSTKWFNVRSDSYCSNCKYLGIFMYL